MTITKALRQQVEKKVRGILMLLKSKLKKKKKNAGGSREAERRGRDSSRGSQKSHLVLCEMKF